MKKKTSRRLSLNRETLRLLESRDLRRAAGGGETDEHTCIRVLTYSDEAGPCTCPDFGCDEQPE